MKTTSLYRLVGFVSLFLISFAFTQKVHAQERHYLLAQTDPEEAFDPFTDYSEFDEASDEEADINFFRNGRFFTVGLAGGVRNFTGNMTSIYGSGPSYGLYLSYFFDLRWAFSMGFLTGDHSVNFGTMAGYNATGNVSMTSMNFDLKYYMNTQNVSRGLADLNPYVIVGLAQYYRTYSILGFDSLSKDATMGIDAGVGIEIPIMRKKAFVAAQACYHYVNFSDENQTIVNSPTATNDRLKQSISGDPYDFMLILGMNF